MDKKDQGKSNREWGTQAELIARDWLLTYGYTIRKQNWRAGKTIEIDIIAELEGTIVFVEVKARKGTPLTAQTLTYDHETPVKGQTPLDAIDERKMQKIVKGADIYLQGLDRLYRYRLDIITVTGTPENYSLEHYPDAFLPPLTT